MNTIGLLHELAIVLFNGDCGDERCHKGIVLWLECSDAKRAANLRFVIYPSEFASKTTNSSSNRGGGGSISSSSGSSSSVSNSNSSVSSSCSGSSGSNGR